MKKIPINRTKVLVLLKVKISMLTCHFVRIHRKEFTPKESDHVCPL